VEELLPVAGAERAPKRSPPPLEARSGGCVGGGPQSVILVDMRLCIVIVYSIVFECRFVFYCVCVCVCVCFVAGCILYTVYCMLYSTVLYCTLVYSSVLYSTVLYCTLLYYTVL